MEVDCHCSPLAASMTAVLPASAHMKRALSCIVLCNKKDTQGGVDVAVSEIQHAGGILEL